MEELVKRAKEGDETAIEQLVDNYKGLIRAYANRYYLVGGDKDDLLQEGMLGLFYAVTKYDENKGSFPAFVELCVLRQILDAVKRDNAAKQKPLYNYVDIIALGDMTDGENTPLEQLLQKEFFQRVVQAVNDQLTQFERSVILLFADGFSYDAIAEKTGKSYKAVDGALQRARKKLLEYK